MTVDIDMTMNEGVEAQVLASAMNENQQPVQPLPDPQSPSAPRTTGPLRNPHQGNSRKNRFDPIQPSSIGGSLKTQNKRENLRNSVENFEAENEKSIQQPTRRSETQDEFLNRLASPYGTVSSASRNKGRHKRSPAEIQAWPSTRTQPRTPTRSTASQRSTLTQSFIQLKIDDASITEEASHGFVCSQCGDREGAGNNATAGDQATVESSTDQPREQNIDPAKKEKPGLLSRFGFGKSDSEKAIDMKETKIMAEKLNNMEEQNRQLHEDVIALETQIQHIQNTSIQAITKSSWTPLEDRVVDTILNEIHSDLDNWCDDYCIKDITSLLSLPREEAEEVVDLARNITFAPLSAMKQIRWWSEQWWTENGDETAHDPSRILKAVLARNMYYDLIANPFVLLDALQANSNEDEGQSKVEKGHKGDEQQYGQELEVGRPSQGFLAVYNSLRRGMLPLNSNRMRRLIRVVHLKKKAAKFRCDILRTFIQSPETGNKFSELKFASGVEETCTSFLAQACPDLVNRAICGPTARLIKHPPPTSALSELVEIWTQAAHLFIQLHTQMTELKFTDTKGFIRKEFTEELVTRHQCHPLSTESHTQVHLVLTPLIILWGNEDGEDYHRYRIISKGTVLVGVQLNVVYTSERGKRRTGHDGDHDGER